MKVLSCNIRCFGAEDGENNWIHRKDFCIEAIRSRNPDIICFQEMWSEQFADISPTFADYNSYAMADEIVIMSAKTKIEMFLKLIKLLLNNLNNSKSLKRTFF